MYVTIQPAAQHIPILCSQLLRFPRFYALFVWSQIMHVTTMYIFLDSTISNYVFPLHFPNLNYRIYLILHFIFLFSAPPSKGQLATFQYNLPELNVSVVKDCSCIDGSRFNGNRYHFSIHWSQLIAINCTRKYHCAHFMLTCLSVLQTKLYCGFSINSNKMVKYV